MKKYWIILVLVLCGVFSKASFGTWDTTTPAGTEAKSLGDNRIREFKTDVQTSLDYEGSFPGTDTANPRFIWTPSSGTTANRPTGNAAPAGKIYINTSSSTVEQFDGSAWQPLLLKSSVFTTNTSGQMLIGQGNGVNPVWQSAPGLILQSTQTRVTTSSTTNSAIFVPTSVTLPITPRFANSKVKITVFGVLQNNNLSGNIAFVTIQRGNTNLGSSTLGLANLDGGTAIQVDAPTTMIYYDTPLTTSATTYTVYMRGTSGGTTVGFPASGGSANMILEEIGQ